MTGAHGDWVLYLDADERLTAGAIQKVLAIKKGAPNHHYSFRRENNCLRSSFPSWGVRTGSGRAPFPKSGGPLGGKGPRTRRLHRAS